MRISSVFLRYVLFVCVALPCCAMLFACKKKEEAPAPAPVLGRTSEAVPAAAPAAESPEPEQGAASAQRAKRKIILSHELTLEVQSLSRAVDQITKLTESCGGYVFNSTRSSQDQKSFAVELGIRVPSGKSGAVLGSLRKLGRVEEESSTADDISDEYVDLEARLKNARASEERLKQMYQRAGTIKDILEVEKELTRVRGDIEAFMAKKRNWDILTEMVTIKITLREPSASLPTAHSFWRPVGTAFGEALEGVAASLRTLIVVTGFLLPWLVILVPLALYLVRRRKRKGKTPAEDKKAERL